MFNVVSLSSCRAQCAPAGPQRLHARECVLDNDDHPGEQDGTEDLNCMTLHSNISVHLRGMKLSALNHLRVFKPHRGHQYNSVRRITGAPVHRGRRDVFKALQGDDWSICCWICVCVCMCNWVCTPSSLLPIPAVLTGLHLRYSPFVASPWLCRRAVYTCECALTVGCEPST